MNLKSLGLSLPSGEPPAWARAARILLRRPNAEFGQSCASVSVNGFLAPNRDYPYEGLTAACPEGHWKFLDALAIAPASPEVRLVPLGVHAFPWKAVYRYAVLEREKHGELHAQYYLLGKSKHPTLEVTFSLYGCRLPRDQLLLSPLADLRPVSSPSSPELHALKTKEGEVRVQRKDSGYALLLHARKLRAVESLRLQDWTYKLGYGEREGAPGFPRFIGESRSLFHAGVYSLPLRSTASLQAVCLCSNITPRFELAKHDEKTETARLQLLLSRFDVLLKKAQERWGKEAAEALAARTLVLLDKFSFSAPPDSLDAGAFWFRQAWSRDLFEAVFVNFDAFYLAKERWLKKELLSCWKHQHNGFLPRLLGSPDSGSSIDGTLFAFLAGFLLLERTQDPKLKAMLLRASELFLSAIKENGLLDPKLFLLKTAADASWMDSRLPQKKDHQTILAPSRLPLSWMQRVIQTHSAEEAVLFFNEPHYFLVELNALWLLFLQHFLAWAPSEALARTKRNAEFNFKSLFFGSTSYGLADESLQRSSEETASCLQAAALASSLFSNEEIAALLEEHAPSLVQRKNQLFGVLVKKGPPSVFYNDWQYHAAVVWPKTNPYLYSLLTRSGRKREAEELLLSLLDHQQNEGAVFYTQELFSTENECTPVKNPAQLFSQYVQPYYNFLEE